MERNESIRAADITVYGATAAGISAALSAKRLNPDSQVSIVEPGNHIGGMVSGGLSYTDLGDIRVIGGIAREFYNHVEAHYGGELGSDFAGPEPHIAERVFSRMLEQAGVEVIFDSCVSSVQKIGNRILKLTTAETEYESPMWIDASYEGDLMAAAGVPYRVGRDGIEAYGESISLAGRQPIAPGRHNFISPVGAALISPFDKDGTLLPFIRNQRLEEQGAAGRGDRALMAYQYRLCLTDDPDNRVPFEPPAGYNADDYELLFRYVRRLDDKISVSDLLGLIKNIPGDKVDANSVGPISLNLLDGTNWNYPDADQHTRQLIAQKHKAYIEGFCYTLANDRRIPVNVRAEFSKWGLAKDEFTDNNHWPHQLYVREARRMLGAYILTQHDIHPGLPDPAGPPTPKQHDSTVMMGSYNIDIREVQRTWQQLLEFDNYPIVVNEGYLSCPVQPYQIPYECFIPLERNCSNLLVPVCASMSHVAFASFRMEPTYMMAGQATGTAAAIAVQKNISVQEISRSQPEYMNQLQELLRNNGQVLET